MNSSSTSLRQLEDASWDEQRFERLLRLAASLQNSPPSEILTDESAGEGARNASSFPPDEIERRAYQNYVRRGGTHGRDWDDWLQAEQDLLRESGKTVNLRLALAFGLLTGFPGQEADSK